MRSKNTILQLSTPNTDHIPSNSTPQNYLDFLPMWWFCLFLRTWQNIVMELVD